MKRRTFLKAAGAFLAAPLAFFGAKKTEKVASAGMWNNTETSPLTLRTIEKTREMILAESAMRTRERMAANVFNGGFRKFKNTTPVGHVEYGYELCKGEHKWH